MESEKLNTRAILGLIRDELVDVKADIKDVKADINSGYVRQESHNALEARVNRLEKALYSVAGMIVMTVVGAVVGLVVTQ